MTGHKKEHYMQTDVWGEVKSDNGWSHEFAGMYDGDRLVASIMMLKKKLPGFPRYLFYAPRGPVADFDEREQIRDLTQLLRGYIRQRARDLSCHRPRRLLSRVRQPRQRDQTQRRLCGVYAVARLAASGLSHEL